MVGHRRVAVQIENGAAAPVSTASMAAIQRGAPSTKASSNGQAGGGQTVGHAEHRHDQTGATAGEGEGPRTLPCACAALASNR